MSTPTLWHKHCPYERGTMHCVLGIGHTVSYHLMQDGEKVAVPSNPAALFAELMSCDTAAEVKALAVRSVIGRPDVDRVDVSGLLTPDARDDLGLDEGFVSLGGLAYRLMQAGEGVSA